MDNYNEKDYWQERYKQGIGSGAGSQGVELRWKRDVYRLISRTFDVASILDIGCGDGAFAAESLPKGGPLPDYLGVDVAPHPDFPDHLSVQAADAVEDDLPEADLVLCLDVLFHIASRERHDALVRRIFEKAKKVAFVATLNESANVTAPHVFYYPFAWPQEFKCWMSGPVGVGKTFFILHKK